MIWLGVLLILGTWLSFLLFWGLVFMWYSYLCPTFPIPKQNLPNWLVILKPDSFIICCNISHQIWKNKTMIRMLHVLMYRSPITYQYFSYTSHNLCLCIIFLWALSKCFIYHETFKETETMKTTNIKAAHTRSITSTSTYWDQ